MSLADELRALEEAMRAAQDGYLAAAEATVALLLADQPDQAKAWAQIAAEHYRSLVEAGTVRRRVADAGGLLLQRLWRDPDDLPPATP